MGHYEDGRNGGEVSKNIREAFHDAIEAFVVWDCLDKGKTPEPTVWLADLEVSLSRICGLTWNCTNVLPMDKLVRLQWFAGERLEGFTYASGARRLRKLIAWRLGEADVANRTDEQT